MGNNDVYLALVDDVWKEIEEKKPKSIDEIDSALYDIQDDYCEEKGLEWEDEL